MLWIPPDRRKTNTFLPGILFIVWCFILLSFLFFLKLQFIAFDSRNVCLIRNISRRKQLRDLLVGLFFPSDHQAEIVFFFKLGSTHLCIQAKVLSFILQIFIEFQFLSALRSTQMVFIKGKFCLFFLKTHIANSTRSNQTVSRSFRWFKVKRWSQTDLFCNLHDCTFLRWLLLFQKFNLWLREFWTVDQWRKIKTLTHQFVRNNIVKCGEAVLFICLDITLQYLFLEPYFFHMTDNFLWYRDYLFLEVDSNLFLVLHAFKEGMRLDLLNGCSFWRLNRQNWRN